MPRQRVFQFWWQLFLPAWCISVFIFWYQTGTGLVWGLLLAVLFWALPLIIGYLIPTGPTEEERSFLLVFPCFIVDTAKGVCCVNVATQECVALFTDDDLVERYLRKADMKGAPIQFNDGQELRSHLRKLSNEGFKDVALDPIDGKSEYLLRIADLLDPKSNFVQNV